MPIGKRTRKTSGPSDYHRAMAGWSCYRMKAALRWTIGGDVTLRTLSDASARLFGEDDRLTEKGMLGNPVTRRLYFRFTTSKTRKTSKVRQTCSRANRRKSAAVLRVDLEEQTARADGLEAERLARIAGGRGEAVGKAATEAREARRARAPHQPQAADLEPRRVRRGRARRRG